LIKNKYIFYILISSLLFLGGNVLNYLGWQIGQENAPSYQKIFPFFYLALLMIPLTFGSKLKEEKKLFFVFFVLIFYLYLTNNTANIAVIPNSLLLAVIISSLFSSINQNYVKNSKKILLAFFIINSSLAILERIIQSNFFKYSGAVDQINLSFLYAFRSTALQDHPLNNSLITSIIMSFILISDMKNKNKYALFTLGYASILCFNTRGSIIGWGILILIYLIKVLFWDKERVNVKIHAFSLIFIIVLFAFYLVFELNLGSRILDYGIVDESSLARVDIIKFLFSFNFIELLRGFSAEKLKSTALLFDLNHLENFWVVYIFRFGILFTALLVYYFGKLFKKLSKGYDKYSFLFVLLTFLLIASTNNSLSTNTIALSIFIILIYTFNPTLNNNSCLNLSNCFRDKS